MEEHGEAAPESGGGRRMGEGPDQELTDPKPRSGLKKCELHKWLYIRIVKFSEYLFSFSIIMYLHFTYYTISSADPSGVYHR